MTGERVIRRLAAILAADVAGYSRLMGRDEHGTLTRLKAHRIERLEPVLARHGGRLVKLTGDGALVEFASAVDALSAAIEFQQAMAEVNADQPTDTALVFRMGLHLGDLIVDGDDLYGDGVNVAARLEAEAPPGGILISRNVRDAVAGRVKATFEDLGGLLLKNIERPVRAFKVHWEPSAWRPLPAAEVTVTPVLTSPSAPTPLPDKPSIAVLPFQNMSGDSEQEYFTDGMVDEIITALSRFKQLFVIARNSSFTYKGRAVDVKQVGRELGVRYVLEGSVRKAGGRVRITGQLIEAASGAHLWADRFEGTLEDIFDLQDKVTVQVVGAIAGLGGPLERAEIERARQKRLVNQSAYDWYLRGNETYFIPTLEAQTKALEMFRRAIEIDPRFAAAYAGPIQPYNIRLTYGWISDLNELSEAIWLARKAIELDPDDPYVLARAGYALASYGGEYDKGRGLVEKAVRLNPNLALAQMWCGLFRMWNGEYCESIEYTETFMRLSPLDPFRFMGPYALAVAYFFLDKPAECRRFAELAVRSAPDAVITRMLEILSLVAVNRIDEAREKFATFAKDYPSLANTTGLRRQSVYRYYRDIEKFVEAFRLAGLSEHNASLGGGAGD